MRLAVRLCLSLGSLLVFLLGGSLWLAYRSETEALSLSREASLDSAGRRLSAFCAAAEEDDWASRCLEGLRFLMMLTPGERISYGLVVDPASRVLVHTDFLKEDFSLRGAVDSRLAVQAGVGAAGPFVQSAGGTVPRERLYSFPVRSDGARRGTLFFSLEPDSPGGDLPRIQGAARLRFIEACAGGAAAGILLSVGLVLYFLGPLQPIAEVSRRIAQGDFKARVPEGRDDELGQLAAEFNRMVARLAELDELKESFITQVTHDLRNPLNAMMMHAELIASGGGAMTAERSESLRVILDSGRALSGLVGEILDVAQLEAGRVEFRPVPLELEASVDSVLDLLRPQAESLGVRLASHVQPGVEQAYADPEGLRRVLTNLVGNALKFTPRGGLVSVQAHRGGPEEVVLVVSDTGVGIPENRVASLFEKFSQVPETRDKVRPSGGTGLGLYISKRMVEGMGGRIWVESKAGEGSNFCVSLPYSKKR